MSQLFGETAGTYHEARPGYPTALADAIREYHGGEPGTLVEIGAGTGLATAVLLGLGATTTCVEPDARMATVLADRFPGVHVVTASFERWPPPAGGVDVLACAMAWHWLDPATRNRRAHDALRPGGTLAVLSHRYAYVEAAQAEAIRAAFTAADPDDRGDRADGWFHDDIAGSGCFTDLRLSRFRRSVPLDTAAYLRLVDTFSPQLRRPPGAARAGPRRGRRRGRRLRRHGPAGPAHHARPGPPPGLTVRRARHPDRRRGVAGPARTESVGVDHPATSGGNGYGRSRGSSAAAPASSPAVSRPCTDRASAVTSVRPTSHSSTYRRTASPESPTCPDRWDSGASRSDRSGSHCTRTGLARRARRQASRSGCSRGSWSLRQACRSAHSNPARLISTASTRSWPGLSAQPQRYIIQRNDGLIQVIRSRLNGGTNRPAASAGSAISAGYAW